MQYFWSSKYGIMKKLFWLALVVLLTPLLSTQAQRKNKKQPLVAKAPTQPKLVVGIVVDQMRYDYLTRFWNAYGQGGFRRLANQGFNCKNHHFNYAPTSTGPGHASVYTGTTPATHGIIGNNWYDKVTETSVYCAADTNYITVGASGNAGKMSPHRMLTTTITDQNRIHTQMRGKTIAIALKDRGAVLPGGHTANAAYWFEGGQGANWITSSYYMKALPSWVTNFNTSNAVEAYKKAWTLLKQPQMYTASGTDENPYEGKFKTETSTAFPHNLPQLWEANGHSSILRYTGYGIHITTDFALAALKEEKLGQDQYTDFLAISYSSTDYAGHMFGVNSVEVQDTYLRLDQDIAKLLTALDQQVGQGNYTVFLTADHGAIHVPAYLQDLKVPAGYLQMGKIKEAFNQFLTYTYGTTDLVKNISNNQVFLDHKVIANLDMDLDDVQEEIALHLLSYPEVAHTYTAHQMWQQQYTHGLPYIVQNGWNQKRSGDVLLVQNRGYVSYPKTGSTHGSAMIYDTHVPLLFYGNGIAKGSTVARTQTPDVAVTIASLLGTAFPNGATGTPIGHALR